MVSVMVSLTTFFLKCQKMSMPASQPGTLGLVMKFMHGSQIPEHPREDKPTVKKEGKENKAFNYLN